MFVLAVHSLIAAGLLRRSWKHATMTLVCSVCHRDSFAVVRLFVELLCRTCLICREQFDRGEPSATIAVMRDNYSSLFKSSSAIETALLFEPESTVFATIATYGTICLQRRKSNLELFF